MLRATLSILLALAVVAPVAAQEFSEGYSKAMRQGDLYMSKRRYALALDAYEKADKAAKHNSAACFLKLASVKRKLGDFPGALNDTKRAIKVAGDDKDTTIKAHLVRASLLAQMAGKPTDKKLREAEESLREVITLDSKHTMARFNLGVILLRQNRDPEGIAELNLFVSARDADPETVADARRMMANPIRAREPFAPDFSFRTHDKQSFSNTALRGKVVLLDFWGTWCPPCRESIPLLRDLNKKYKGKPFQLIGISSDDDEEVWRTFMEEQRMDWPGFIDLDGDVLKAFSIESFPTYIVLDKDGVIRYRQSGLGYDTEMELESAINKALKRQSDPALAAAGSAPPADPDPPAAEKGEPPETTPLLDIEDGTFTEDVYKNEALGLTFAFPRGWVPAKPQSLHAMNERAEADMKARVLQQHPELGTRVFFSIPKTIFYASRRGDGNAERMSVPCISIKATQSRVDELSLDMFTPMAENMATASRMKIIAEPAEFTVKDHSFLRVDFERSGGSSRIYHVYVQTLAGEYLLTIEAIVSTQNELQQITAALQSMVITE